MAKVKKILVEKKVQSRTCSQCNKKVPLSEYYNNTKNYEWHCKDKWCKSCVKKFVKNLETLQLYCRFNNRAFSQDLYQTSEATVIDMLKADEEYLKIKDLDKKEAYKFDKIFGFYIKRMGLPQYYLFENHDYDIDQTIKDKEQEISEQNAELHMQKLADDSQKIWDTMWYGEYSKNELDYLNKFYDELKRSFEISDAQLEATVKEVAKASLEMNQAFNDMRAGVSGAAVRYQNARDTYLKLSDNAKLSASKRTANDKIGFSDLGNIIKRIENTGALMKKVTFPKDDIDFIREDFRHVLSSFEGEDLSGGNN